MALAAAASSPIFALAAAAESSWFCFPHRLYVMPHMTVELISKPKDDRGPDLHRRDGALLYVTPSRQGYKSRLSLTKYTIPILLSSPCLYRQSQPLNNITNSTNKLTNVVYPKEQINQTAYCLRNGLVVALAMGQLLLV
jgi:hypothetical protein